MHKPQQRILSINFNHDGAAVILDRGKIAAYVNTERFSRNKKHPGIREEDLDEVLTQAQLQLSEIDFVILVNYGMASPEIKDRFGTDLQDTVINSIILEGQDRVSMRGRKLPCWTNPDHFLCHSAVAYYYSPFDSATCFAFDPLGSGVHVGRGNRLDPVSHRKSYVGELYSNISIRLLKVGGIFGAGKTMALASYCDARTRKALEPLLQTVPASRFATPTECYKLFLYVENLISAHPQCYEGKWNIAAAYIAQRLLEIELVRVLDEILPHVPAEALRKQLCLSGGSALNTVANELGFQGSQFDDLYLHPACGDDGTAIGAALYYWHHVQGNPKLPHHNREAMFGVRRYDDCIIDALHRYKERLVWTERDDYKFVAAQKLASGQILAWFDGASEIGPRALGHRSIVCAATETRNRQFLNDRVKKRESFRPFAPAVLEEHCQELFDIDSSPFMLRAVRVKSEAVPAVTHVDGTARVQTVRREDNENYYDLIAEFHRLTGVPVILNTSFNINGEPVVETPEHAIETFLASEIDCLVFPNFIIEKANSIVGNSGQAPITKR